MWAMGNAIFLLLGLGAILDPEPQSFGPKVTGSLALLAAGAMQGRGLGPQYSQNARLFTAVFLAFDALVIAGIWLIR